MSPDLVVTLDLAVRRGGTTDRLRACHALRGGRVDMLIATRGAMSQGIIDVREWRGELTRMCRVAVPDGAPSPPADAPDLPWDLVVGTGAALAGHRPELHTELLARVDAPLRAQVTWLHAATLGRLRATGVLRARRRVGRLSWLLFADGWRALTPYVGSGAVAGAPMVRLERRVPEDLARDVARWVAAVSR